jgi:hypothetical protein
MSTIMTRIGETIRIGSPLKTPSGYAEFTVSNIRSNEVILEIGETKNELRIPAACFEGAPDFLRDKGWIRISAKHGEANVDTFDGYVQGFTRGISAASYVAPILEEAGIVEIDRSRPAKLRLKK